MKLINEKNTYIFSAYLLIFAIVGLLFYFTVYSIIYLDYKEKLEYRKHYTIKQLKDIDSLLTYSKFSGYTLSISAVKNIPTTKDEISDTVIYDDVENRFIQFRQLKFYASNNGKNFRISVRRSLIETEDIIQGLVIVIAIIFIILLLLLVFVNHWISNKVWKPFFNILERIKRFEVGKFYKIDFPETNISEFKELIEVLNRLMDKISRDFLSLKEFTENISHEVQTPLSVIKSKLELLIQSETMNDKEVQLLNSSYQAINKLSKLTEALSLLIKIDNYQFSNSVLVNFNELFEVKFEAYKELMEIKNIELSKKITGNFYSTIDPVLADILAENLVVNSIKHNNKGGKIFLEVEDSEICISNTGKKLMVEPEKLFQRFIKSNSESLGLGLSIVKNICQINKLEVGYTFDSSLHKICITMRQ